MWAILDYDNKTVVDLVTPDKTFDEAKCKANGRTLIEMTIKNSPAYLLGIYENEKFYPPKEITNV